VKFHNVNQDEISGFDILILRGFYGVNPHSSLWTCWDFNTTSKSLRVAHNPPVGKQLYAFLSNNVTNVGRIL
jgi:hypothetical protein